MFFNSYTDLNNLLCNNLHKIPQVDLIVGIPRSGMIVATMLSEYLNIQCCSFFEYTNNITPQKLHPEIGSGVIMKEINPEKIKTILLVDDTVATGGSMDLAKNILKKYSIKVITFAPYILPGSENKVDIFLLSCEDHYFPWNIFKRKDLMTFACVDIDGVICPNVPGEFDDDGDKYINFLSNDKVLIRPQCTIGAFVTSRLEKYRSITEKWLKENNISYKYLKMLDLPNNEERSKISVADYKGNLYKKSNAKIFIESSWNEARRIFQITNKPVYCIENGQFLQ